MGAGSGFTQSGAGGGGGAVTSVFGRIGAVVAAIGDYSFSQISGVNSIVGGGTNSSTALANNRMMVSVGGAIVEHSAQTSTRVAYYNASGLPIGDANFVWDDTNKSLKLGGATTTSWFSAFQNDPSLAGVTSWINLVEDGRDAHKDFFKLTSTKTTATAGGTDMVMKSRGSGATTFTMLNDGTEWFAIKPSSGVAMLSTVSSQIICQKAFAPVTDSNINLGTTTRAWGILYLGTSINQLGNAAGTATNLNILLGNTRDDGLANNSAMIITGNVDYANTHYLSIRGGVTNSTLFTIAPLGRIGIALGGATASAVTPTAYVDIVGSTIANASLRMRSGVAPTSPNLGEAWYDGANFFVRATTRNDQIARVLTGSATLDFPSIPNNSEADLTIAVTGAALGDCVALGVPNGSQSATLIWYAWVSAANTVTVRCSHPFAGGAINPASGTFKVTVFKNI